MLRLQGKGYAGEAVKGLLECVAHHPSFASRPVFAEKRPDNEASIRLLIKVGLVATGRPGHRSNRVEFVLPPKMARRLR
jgi:RimJ/RimL family protein N-acetyltransferase